MSTGGRRSPSEKAPAARRMFSPTAWERLPGKLKPALRSRPEEIRNCPTAYRILYEAIITRDGGSTPIFCGTVAPNSISGELRKDGTWIFSVVVITDYIRLMSRTVIAAVDDMLFISKIRATAEHVGVNVRFARNADALLARARENKPNLIIVDLHAQKIDPLALAMTLKADPELQAIVLLGFFSHVQTDLMIEATKAGYDRVMPRSAFSKDLANILAG